MPLLGGATGWLNSEPLSPAELRGHVVVVNFWTLTCINWLRQEPYVRAWSQAYRADGLVVIGVHTPEFSFEHEIDGVRQATKQRGIDYPVAVDNDYEIGTTCVRPRRISATGGASTSRHRTAPRSTSAAPTSSPSAWASTTSLAEGDPRYDELERRLADGPVIAVPAITLDGDSDGVAPATDGTSYAKRFSGKRTHRIVKGVGHNLPQEAPQAFSEAVVEVDGY